MRTFIVPSWNLVYGHCPTVEPGLRPLSHRGTWSTAIVPPWNVVYGHCPTVEPGLRPLSHRGTWSTAIVPPWNLVYGHCPTVEPGLRPLSHCGTWSTATQGTYKCKTRAYADVAHAQCVCSTSDEMNDAQLIVSVTRDCAFARTWQQASKSLGVPAYYGVRQAFCAVL